MPAWMPSISTFFRRPVFIALLALVLGTLGAHIVFFAALLVLALQFQARDQLRHDLSEQFAAHAHDDPQQHDPYEGRKVEDVPPPKRVDPEHFKYPDREEGVWFSRVFSAFWDQMEPYLSSTTEASLKATLDWYRPSYIQDMYFEVFTLGKRAPQLSKFAVYPTDSPSRVKWDFDLNYSSQAKITLRIKFGPQMLWVNVPVKVKSLMLATRVRLDMDFMGDYPYVAVLGMSLLEKPRIDFVLKPMKSLDVMDLPGISRWLHNVTVTSLESAMMWPLKWEVPLKEWYGPPWDEFGNPIREKEDEVEEGMERVVRLKIQGAKSLPTSSRVAYLEMTCGDMEYATQKVPVSEYGGSCFFAESWEFPLDAVHRNIRVNVFRAGATGGWLLGTAQIPLTHKQKTADIWYQSVPSVSSMPLDLGIQERIMGTEALDDDTEPPEVCISIEVVTMPKALIGKGADKPKTKLSGVKKAGQKVFLNPMKKVGGGVLKGVIGVGKFALKPLKVGKKKGIKLAEAAATNYFEEGQTLADLIIGWGCIEMTIMKARNLVAPASAEDEGTEGQKDGEEKEQKQQEGRGGGGGGGQEGKDASKLPLDSYCVLSFAQQEVRTELVKNSTDPVWGEVHELIFINGDLTQPTDYLLSLDVRAPKPTADTGPADGSDHVVLGSCQIDLSALDDTPSLEWYPVTDSQAQHTGDVSIGFKYKPVAKDPYSYMDSEGEGEGGSEAGRSHSTSTAVKDGASKGAVRDIDGVTSLLRVHIEGTKEGKRFAKKNRIYFIVKITVDQNSWTIDRRHKDFASLHKRLTAAYPNKDLPTLPDILSVETQDRDDWQLLADYLLTLMKDDVIMKSGDANISAFLSPGVYKDNAGK